ncbi:MAG TPA: DUF2486 family protein [Trinickia sp.]|jgi:hypothetical protein|nr:DUF2486 family protein [Trinickia sp.]
MTDPHDPDSIPMLTDVIVPGRPPVGRPAQPHEDASAVPAQAQAHAHAPAAEPPPVAAEPSPPATEEAATFAASGSVETMPQRPQATPRSDDAPVPRGAAFDARDVEFIAERLRGRFSSYLREDARRVIEARCRDAIEEHTNWLVRQVTREVVSALEAEVAGWVRDAVREELARHTS